MALLIVTGEPGCREDEIARLAAQQLGFELYPDSALRRMVEDQYGAESSLPDKAWPHLLASILAKLAVKHHIVTSIPGAEFLLRQYASVLRVSIVAPPAYRTGMLMLERRLERPEASVLLAELDKERSQDRRRKFGRATSPPHFFDLTLNAALMDSEAIASVLLAAAGTRALVDQGHMPASVEAEIQFQVRLQLARFSIRPRGDESIKPTAFVHPSEEIFANLLDFYRIAWEYEPRSFPLEWDAAGNILEAFTPDFYLPEFDLYVELTTMKQSLVTKKNRKVRLLRQIYPEINIQIFYQKDFQNLIFKYGLVDRTVRV
jgi:hypothetical protein